MSLNVAFVYSLGVLSWVASLNALLWMCAAQQKQGVSVRLTPPMPVEFPRSSLVHDSCSCPMYREVMGRSQTWIGQYECSHVPLCVVRVKLDAIYIDCVCLYLL